MKVTVDGHFAAQSLRKGRKQRHATIKENFGSLNCITQMRGNLTQALWACNVVLHSEVADAAENGQSLSSSRRQTLQSVVQSLAHFRLLRISAAHLRTTLRSDASQTIPVHPLVATHLSLAAR